MKRSTKTKNKYKTDIKWETYTIFWTWIQAGNMFVASLDLRKNGKTFKRILRQAGIRFSSGFTAGWIRENKSILDHKVHVHPFYMRFKKILDYSNSSNGSMNNLVGMNLWTS